MFSHPALEQIEDKKLVYTAMSKHLFYYRMHISKYVLENNAVPLNPFMIFDYFLLDTVDRNLIRSGNNNVIKKCDEVWVFGTISNGVLAEIRLAQSLDIPVKYFRIDNPHMIIPIQESETQMEDAIKNESL